MCELVHKPERNAKKNHFGFGIGQWFRLVDVV
jgi:hypothetical protein